MILQLSKLNVHEPITSDLPCLPETNENIWHYALSNDKTDIINYLLEKGDESLIESHHEIQRSGMHGSQNALHILIEKGDTETAKRVLDRITGRNNKLDMMQTETVTDIEGERPRHLSCLQLAAYKGESDLVNLFLTKGIHVNSTNEKGDTALHWAARSGRDVVVDTLIKKNADVELKNDIGSTALHWAVRHGHVATVERLLHGNADPNAKQILGLVAPLVIAAAYGNNKIVQLLLSKPECDVNIYIQRGEGPIHHAAKQGHLDVLTTLLLNGAKPDFENAHGDTPLLLAAQQNHSNVVKELISHGANIFHKNHEKNDVWNYAIDSKENALLATLIAVCNEKCIDMNARPLCIAAASGRNDKIEFILNTLHQDPSATDTDKNTFLHHAAMNNENGVIEKFHTFVLINSQDDDGNTPLHIACSKGFDRTVLTLLRCKAKTDVKNKNEETPLHSAANSHNIATETVRALVTYTINTRPWETLNLIDCDGNNCLHVASKFARPEVLWEFRAWRLTDINCAGNTPLHEAFRSGHPEALSKLFEN